VQFELKNISCDKKGDYYKLKLRNMQRMRLKKPVLPRAFSEAIPLASSWIRNQKNYWGFNPIIDDFVGLGKKPFLWEKLESFFGNLSSLRKFSY
jgi:hypothetical protein